MGRQAAMRSTGERRHVRAAVGLALLALPGALGQDAAPRKVEERRLGTFGSFTADASNPTFDTSGPTGMQGPLPMLSPEQGDAVSAQSSQLAAGMIQAFLGKTQLEPGEAKCIKSGSTTISGDLARLAAQMALVVKTTSGSKNFDIPGIADTPDEIQAEADARAKKRTRATDTWGFDSSSDFGDDSWGDDGGVSDMVAQIEKDQLAKVPTRTQATPSFAAPPAPAPAAAAPAPSSAQTQAANAAAKSSLAFFYGERRLQDLPPEYAASMGGQQGSMFGAGMASMPMALEMGFMIKQISKTSEQLTKQCVQGDASAAFKEARAHMKNLRFVSGHFLANGADILNELADASVAYEKKNLTRVGWNVGLALRKVLLGNETSKAAMPKDADFTKMTTSMMAGFFGPGSQAKLTWDKDPTNPLYVNMNKCTNKNQDFFQQAWASLMYLYEQKALKKKDPEKAKQEQAAFAMQATLLMMEVPKAMKKCNIDEEHKDMLEDSIKSLGSGVHFQFHLPSEQTDNDEMRAALAQSVTDWHAKKWEKFGGDLGDLMQKALLRYNPKVGTQQKYYLDSDGQLRRQLLGLEAAGGSLDGGIRRGAKYAPVLTMALACVVPVFVVALLALRSRSLKACAEHLVIQRRHLSVEELEDAEAGPASDRVTSPLFSRSSEEL